MDITVFGATGGTGRHVVEQALDDGHRVTAVVRDPGRLPVPPREGFVVFTARLDDRAAVLGAVADADAVVDVLGVRESGPTTFRADTARVVTAAMRDAGVRRLVAVSASGAHTAGDSLPIRLLVKPVLGRFLRHQFADMRAMEDVVRESGLDWTIVLPPRLTEGPATGRIRRRVGGNVRGSYSMTRADLATAVLEAVTDDAVRSASLSVAAG